MPIAKEPNKNDRRYIRTEKEIRAAFLRLAETKDLEKISVSALSREANIDRKTFYLHYPSIDELIKKMLDDEALIIVERLRANAMSRSADEAPDLLRDLSMHLALDVASLRNIVSHVSLSDQVKSLEQPLTEAIIEDNGFKFSSGLENPDYYVTFLIAGLLAVYRRWLLTESDIPLEQISGVAHTFIKFIFEKSNNPATANARRESPVQEQT